MRDYLFIYGTLLPGHAPDKLAKVVDRLSYVGKASVPGKLYDLGKYPGAILDPSSQTRVFGRVFELPEDQGVLQALDSYEEFKPDDLDNSLFVREQITVSLRDGRSIQCWIYVYNQDTGTAPLVSSGDYMEDQAA
jgi:gamma-glutamylcyclotransferase (GGCT)/AIG2-like uncharacterized protein YtfP